MSKQNGQSNNKTASKIPVCNQVQWEDDNE